MRRETILLKETEMGGYGRGEYLDGGLRSDEGWTSVHGKEHIFVSWEERRVTVGEREREPFSM